MHPEPKLSDEIAANDTYRALVSNATRDLWAAVGDVPSPVEVSWKVDKDHRGGDEFRLTLRDDHGVAVGLFSADELSAPYRARGKYYRVWGNLYRDRTRSLLREFNELIGYDGGAA